MLLMKALHHLPSPFSFPSMTWPFQGSLQLHFTPRQLRTEEEGEKEMNKTHSCADAGSLGWVGTPHNRVSSSAAALRSPRWLLSRAGVLPAGAPDKARPSHLTLTASRTRGRSEISLLVTTDTTFKAATATPRGFALRLFGETNRQPALVPSTNGTGVLLPLGPRQQVIQQPRRTLL